MSFLMRFLYIIILKIIGKNEKFQNSVIKWKFALIYDYKIFIGTRDIIRYYITYAHFK